MTAAPMSSSPAPSDSELVAAIANGNLEALGILFERHEPTLRRYFGRLGVTASDADDLVQTTFLEVARAASRFDATYTARTWLLGIATMIIRRHRRSIFRRATRLAEWAGVMRVDAAVTPTDIFESTDAERRIVDAFGRLSAKKREAFVLVALEGLSGEEAAKTLGIPVNTVWTRLHHARRELRAALEDGDA